MLVHCILAYAETASYLARRQPFDPGKQEYSSPHGWHVAERALKYLESLLCQQDAFRRRFGQGFPIGTCDICIHSLTMVSPTMMIAHDIGGNSVKIPLGFGNIRDTFRCRQPCECCLCDILRIWRARPETAGYIADERMHVITIKRLDCGRIGRTQGAGGKCARASVRPFAY